MTDGKVSFINNTFHSDFKNASYCVPHHKHMATMETLGSSLIINYENYYRKDIIIVKTKRLVIKNAKNL